MTELLLCCDLDRTLLPNGLQAESAHSREIFHEVIKQCQIILVYVSGRDLALIQEAINEYAIPIPDFAICDVGTSLYKYQQHQWQAVEAWTNHLAQEWSRTDLANLTQHFADSPLLRLQETQKQGRFKLSFYTDPKLLTARFIAQLESDIAHAGFKACLITSVDETTNTGLVDILPSRASKYHAIEFLVHHLGKTFADTVFAGDSGNDLPVITSEVPSVLVNNAQDSVKAHALQLAEKNGYQAACYVALGDWHGLNGNYSAGILEGLVHYHPERATCVEKIIRQVTHSAK